MRLHLIFAGAIGCLAIAAMGMPARAEQPKAAPAPEASQFAPIPVPEGTVEPQAVTEEAECEEMSPGVPMRRPCLYGKLLNKWASYGAFNCGCSGSYKYPVPPQYTYHWPGMYSQQTMTEYVSPYRFPPLKPPPKGENLLEPQPEEPEGKVSGRVPMRAIRPASGFAVILGE